LLTLLRGDGTLGAQFQTTVQEVLDWGMDQALGATNGERNGSAGAIAAVSTGANSLRFWARSSCGCRLIAVGCFARGVRAIPEQRKSAAAGVGGDV